MNYYLINLRPGITGVTMLIELINVTMTLQGHSRSLSMIAIIYYSVNDFILMDCSNHVSSFCEILGRLF